jgi:serine/threonine-protein kinase
VPSDRPKLRSFDVQSLAPALLDVESMIGEVVGNYEVLSCIGEGGMGAVYLARHRLIGRRAAIKVLLPGTCTNDEIVQRFFNEARSTSEVKHAGLIDVFDFGYHKGSAYIAMEFLEGESLAARLHREPRPRVELVAAVGRQRARSPQRTPAASFTAISSPTTSS